MEILADWGGNGLLKTAASGYGWFLQREQRLAG